MQDVRSVRPHVRAEVVGERWGCELGEVLRELVFRVSPGEVRVRLGEADLCELFHDAWPGERLREEDHVGIVLAQLARAATPRSRTASCGGCRRGTRARPGHPEAHHAQQGGPERDPVLGVEVEGDDVLVVLRRVLGVGNEPSGRWRNQAGCSRTQGWSGAAWKARSSAISIPFDCAAVTRRSKSAKVPRDGWMALCPPSALPIAHGLPGSSVGRLSCCSRPCGARNRSGGSAAGTRRRSPSPRSCRVGRSRR